MWIVLDVILIFYLTISSSLLIGRPHPVSKDVKRSTPLSNLSSLEATLELTNLSTSPQLNIPIFSPRCYDGWPISTSDCDFLLADISHEPHFGTIRHWAVPHDASPIKTWRLRNGWCEISLYAEAAGRHQIHDDFSYSDVRRSASVLVRQCVAQRKGGTIPTGHGMGFWVRVDSPIREPQALRGNESIPDNGNDGSSAVAATEATSSLLEGEETQTETAGHLSSIPSSDPTINTTTVIGIQDHNTTNTLQVICIDNPQPPTIPSCRRTLLHMRRDPHLSTIRHWIGTRRDNPLARWQLIRNPCHVDIVTPSEDIVKQDSFSVGEAYAAAVAVLGVCVAEGQDGMTYVGHLGGGFMVMVGRGRVWEPEA